MLLNKGSLFSGITWILGGITNVESHDKAKNNVIKRYEPQAPQAAKTKPMMAGPTMEDPIHTLAIQAPPVTVMALGTT